MVVFYLVLFIRLRALAVLLKVTVLEGQYCGRGWIFCRNCCGLMASIPFDSSLKHGIGSLLLACASEWVKNTEGINKAHDRK